MICYLPDAESAVDPPEMAGVDHPMRLVTRSVAFDAEWTAETAQLVQSIFDDMASTWNEGRSDEFKRLPLEDALDRGDVGNPDLVIELGSGTGLGTQVLAERFSGRVAAFDIAVQMLNEADAIWGSRTQADAGALPLATDSVDLVVLVNALLFPTEVDRVLQPDGAVVWVNSLGENTPIHLTAEDVALSLPGDWDGLASRSGTGIWSVLRRVSKRL